MTSVHLIEVKAVGASNTKGTRVKITSLRFGDSLTVPYDYDFNTIKDLAESVLKKIGFKCVAYGYNEKNGTYVICSTTFESLKESAKTVKNLLSQGNLHAKGWHKDHNNYNKAEKWERTPVKRKTPAKNIVKAKKKS